MSDNREPKCHWDADLGWLTPEHKADCKAHDCAGCRPCPKSHCAMRGNCANHLGVDELTCPSCIGKVRTTLAKIEQRMTDLPDQVEARGINSEALNLNGPASLASPLVPHPYDAEHPLLVLGRWDMMIREDYGHDTALTLTVSRARDYLDRNLARIANDPEQDFELFSREVAGCLTHLETVLDDSRQPERGAPCPTCRAESPDEAAPRLVKKWADKAADDHWQCPRNPKHKWGDEDYRKRVDGDYLDHADRLTATDMHRKYQVKPGRLRKWAERGDVSKRGRDAQGRMLYDVADTLARRDTLGAA